MTGNLTIKNKSLELYDEASYDNTIIFARKYNSTSNGYKSIHGNISGNVLYDLYLPNETGTLATQAWVNGDDSGDGYSYDSAVLYKIGRVVVCMFNGTSAYKYRSSTLFIDDAHYEFRPARGLTFFVYVYKSDTDAYMGTGDLFSSGYLQIKFQKTISSRDLVNNTGHQLYGCACWSKV